jgi:hypothetical protein
VTDARILAKRMEWAATSEAGRNQAFNIVNGDIFRWLWPTLAADFGIEAASYPSQRMPLEPENGGQGPDLGRHRGKDWLVKHDLSSAQMSEVRDPRHWVADCVRAPVTSTEARTRTVSEPKYVGFLPSI